MNLSTLFRLLTQHFSSADPRIEEEAKRLEDEEGRKNGAKAQALAGYKRIAHMDDAYSISRWFREVGHAIKLGQVAELEIWQRGDHFRLAVRKEEWEVYVVIPEPMSYQLRRRLV